MAAVLSPHSSPDSPPLTALAPSSPNSVSRNLATLPPLITGSSSRPSNSNRTTSWARDRLSTFSNTSNTQSRSRPQSTVFPFFLSSLSYTLVRDFAYPAFHPLHYGPASDEQSHVSTPASESHRRLSHPSVAWEDSRVMMQPSWGLGEWASGGDEQLPPTSFGDGPPWSEDEDLHSPIVTSSKHKKHKSNLIAFDNARGRRREYVGGPRGSFSATNGDGSQTYYISDANDAANGPGGEYITYTSKQSTGQPNNPTFGGHVGAGNVYRKNATDRTLPPRAFGSDDDVDAEGQGEGEELSSPSDADSPAYLYTDESRFSRNYQFTIASPDEEMHGKAVALFDFARENENELPLLEGQVILVSYRHGQGWLVAQDPKTGESGLVPEEYVRLLRDIEGGWSGLMNGGDGGGNTADGNGAATVSGPDAGGERDVSGHTVRTPTQSDPQLSAAASGNNENANTTSGDINSLPGSNVSTPTPASFPVTFSTGCRGSTGGHADRDYYTPVVSTFSTSSKDLHPYRPQHLLGSHPNTPTDTRPLVRRGSQDSRRDVDTVEEEEKRYMEDKKEDDDDDDDGEGENERAQERGGGRGIRERHGTDEQWRP